MGSLLHGLYQFSDLLFKLIYLQILWLLFTIVGLGIFGIVPASISLFTVFRKLFRERNSHTAIFSVFWQTYKKEFLKGNLIGVGLGLLIYLIGVNYIITGFMAGIPKFMFAVFMLVTILFFVVVLFYIFPVYVHFELPIIKYFTFTLLIAISYPIYTIGLLIGVGALYYLFLLIPGFIPFFSVSLIAAFISWLSLKIFTKIEQQNLLEPNKG